MPEVEQQCERQDEMKVTSKNYTIRIGKSLFQCSCGCNVFHKPDKDNRDLYCCNACETYYEAVGREEKCQKCAEEIERLREESRNLYAALERIYGKLLMSDRDGDAHITEEDGAMAEAALKKARGEE